MTTFVTLSFGPGSYRYMILYRMLRKQKNVFIFQYRVQFVYRKRPRRHFVRATACRLVDTCRHQGTKDVQRCSEHSDGVHNSYINLITNCYGHVLSI